MNTVGRAVRLTGAITILFFTFILPAVHAERAWPPVGLLKEKSQFEEQAIATLVNAQTGLTLKEQPTQRGQHPKHLGCVEATFKVDVDSVDENLKKGLFEKSAEYDSLIRFSKGSNNHDGEADSFGMAIKVFGVPGDKILPDESSAMTQDFILASNEFFIAPNPFLLLQFKKAEREGKKNLLDAPLLTSFNLDYLWFGKIVTNSRFLPGNVLKQPYWSQTPYKLGDLHVKYFVVGDSELPVKGRIPIFINDLRHFMQEDLNKKDVTFDFVIQEWPEGGHSDIEKAPIEDPRYPWSAKGTKCDKEDCTRVATITIPKQTFLTPGKMAFCEQLSFTPWHSLAAHEPIGGINRARKVVYQLGSKMRHVVNQTPRVEPTWQDYLDVKRYDEHLRTVQVVEQKDLAQGWSQDVRKKYYHTPQGTRVIPYAWLLALERMDRFGKKNLPFLDDANIALYGFLPDPSRPDGLPLGFARSEDKEGEIRWVDLTCAACHTHELKYKGRIIRIDGGPSMQLNRAFLTGLVGALKETVERPEKFERFAGKVFKILLRTRDPVLEKLQLEIQGRTRPKGAADEIEHPDATWRNQVRSSVREYMNELIRLKVTEGTKNLFPTDWGHGRIDALGRGGNTLLSALDPDNVRQVNAPVSIPKIWDAWKHDWVQWNGSMTQPTGRNIAQAIGIRSEMVLETSNHPEAQSPKDIMAGSLNSPLKTEGDPSSPEKLVMETSINLTNLVALEQQIRKLRPPRWPAEILGQRFILNHKRASEGKRLYVEHCIGCHVPNEKEHIGEDKRRRFYVNPHEKHDYNLNPWPMKLKDIVSLGTDPTAANNFLVRRVQTGRLSEPLGGKLKRADEVLQKLTTELRTHLLDKKVGEVCEALRVEESGITDTDAQNCKKIHHILKLLEDSFDIEITQEEKEQKLKEIEQARNKLLADLKLTCEKDLLVMDENGVSKKVCTLLELVDQDKGRRHVVESHFRYIARTNAGMWATAPFLHNGSVLNLYELLSPVDQRKEQFCLGKADFDPQKVGFELRLPPCLPLVESELDTNLPGNSNMGHEFRGESTDHKKKKHYENGKIGPELKPEQRWALIEYLKTLDCEFLTLDCTVDGAEKVLEPEPDAVVRIVTRGEPDWVEDRWWREYDSKPGFWAPK